MNKFLLSLCLLASVLIVVEGLLDGGIITIPAATAGLVGIKVAAGLIGLGVGKLASRRGSGSRRVKQHFRRSVQVEASFLAASIDDADDCAKKLICLLNTDAKDSLDSDESVIRGLFGSANELDVAKDSVEFDVAALVGRKTGAARCHKIYARCVFNREDLMNVLRAPENGVTV
ncbi:hypothetical protein TCAL_14714 [Tigriopus californicus]|uniref:Uncharacterized protein n=1 Tax=Tigriopus californicus TaxID=6832 RepID=A0A553PGU4_TIGCA|nr:uncharacterized protein LOC131881050 [Tigriopus californicus]TRY76903.1 hypothetical protein TCAL_14714 [Tigriopus californicus]